MPGRRRFVAPAVVGVGALLVCGLLTEVPGDIARAAEQLAPEVSAPAEPDEPAPAEETVRLAFAGDVHFEGAQEDVPSDSDSTLGPMSQTLQDADLAMVNLESAVGDGGGRADKELEDPSNRFWFRTGADALGVLGRSGVDVVSVANNHGGDYGLSGLRDTIRAGEAGEVDVIGLGRNEREAFAPHRVNIKGTDVAVHAADASPRESADATWSAEAGTGPGIAAARGRDTRALEASVRASARTDDLVVVYLHWGEEGNECATGSQQSLARSLGEAGADVIVGTHAHVPLGAGMQDSTYVSYGLGNFYWYHGRQSETGVLNVAVRGDEVVADEWVPARFREGGGGPRPLDGGDREDAVEEWEDLRGCTDLEPGPGPASGGEDDGGGEEDPALPAFASSVNKIGRSVRLGMDSFDPEVCPVPLADLRHVVVTHVGFDGRAQRGELVVNADVAEDVVDVFAALYEERFPIQRMLLVDEYAGDDDRSMAANNSSAFNCRRVAGQSSWSDHAYGRAIDINPVQNPYVVGGEPRPPAAREFVDADRSEGTEAGAGVITDGDVARTAFERIGWSWGGDFPEPDYQHFSKPE